MNQAEVNTTPPQEDKDKKISPQPENENKDKDFDTEFNNLGELAEKNSEKASDLIEGFDADFKKARFNIELMTALNDRLADAILNLDGLTSTITALLVEQVGDASILPEDRVNKMSQITELLKSINPKDTLSKLRELKAQTEAQVQFLNSEGLDRIDVMLAQLEEGATEEIQPFIEILRVMQEELRKQSRQTDAEDQPADEGAEKTNLISRFNQSLKEKFSFKEVKSPLLRHIRRTTSRMGRPTLSVFLRGEHKKTTQEYAAVSKLFDKSPMATIKTESDLRYVVDKIRARKQVSADEMTDIMIFVDFLRKYTAINFDITNVDPKYLVKDTDGDVKSKVEAKSKVMISVSNPDADMGINSDALLRYFNEDRVGFFQKVFEKQDDIVSTPDADAAPGTGPDTTTPAPGTPDAPDDTTPDATAEDATPDAAPTGATTDAAPTPDNKVDTVDNAVETENAKKELKDLIKQRYDAADVKDSPKRSLGVNAAIGFVNAMLNINDSDTLNKKISQIRGSENDGVLLDAAILVLKKEISNNPSNSEVLAVVTKITATS